MKPIRSPFLDAALSKDASYSQADVTEKSINPVTKPRTGAERVREYRLRKKAQRLLEAPVVPKSLRTLATMTSFCARVAAGRSMVEVCTDDDMPSYERMFDWLADDPVFRERYELAKAERAETTRKKLLGLGERVVEDPAMESARVTAAASCYSKAEALGNRTRTEISGAGGGPVRVEVSDQTAMRELARRVALCLRLGAGGLAGDDCNNL